MNRKLLVLLISSLTCVCVNGTLDIRATSAPLTNLVNRITNTTFGIVRGSLSFFGRAVDRIINTFGRVEDRLRHLLEEFRKLLVTGLPEFNIPVLDPLHVDKIQFNVVHEAAKIKGSARDVTVRHISKFIVDKEKFTDMGGWKFKLDLNLTFRYLRVDGLYDVDGLIGDTFKLYGNGKFWLNLYDLKIGTSTIIKFEYPRLRVKSMNIDIKLRKLENRFENLMNDKETGELFNKAISTMAPEALDILWPELKGPIEKQVVNYINHVLENASVANLARRLFNIR